MSRVPEGWLDSLLRSTADAPSRPSSAFREAAVEEFCERHQIYLDVIPGEADWKVSVVEQAVKGTKELISKLLEDEPGHRSTYLQSEGDHSGLHPDAARPLDIFLHKGDATGAASGEPNRRVRQVHRATEDCRASPKRVAGQATPVQSRAFARKAGAGRRAGRTGVLLAVTGERTVTREPEDRHGQFLGPARVLATETNRDDQGHLMPSSSAWLVRRGAGSATYQDPPNGEGRRATASRPSPYARTSNSSGGQWWSEVQEALWSDDAVYWKDRQAAIEVEVALPESKQGLDKACRDLPTYFMNSMKKRAVEISEKRLTEEERALFRSAKLVEVKNFVAAQAFETIPEGQRPSKEQAVNMRWILTWKQKEDGSVKPKARAVLLGYQDPAYENRATTAPVMSRQTRQLVLQIAANRNWRALGIPLESITRLRRACYGLVDAPLDTVIGIITGHVDDFLFTGDEQHPKWQQTIKAIKERFQWGDWDYDDFVQCGHHRARKKPTEGLLGAISWHAQQVAPHAEVSLLLSEVSQSDGETIAKANACLRRARAGKDHVMKIHAYRSGEDLGLYGWVDAGNQNRVDGYSTQGIFIGVAPTSLLQGELCPISPVAWHSNRIERACRSPGAAEAHAAINSEDSLFYARYQWHELLHGAGDVRNPVGKVLGCLITDSRNVYDKLVTAVLTIKGAEKRTNMEMIALKESQE
ncbi:GIP [Symbiodinium sp. CCMP2592]|nr:GIP [Symbiodinium sp. CCMP2592]